MGKQLQTILIGAALAAGGLFLWTRMSRPQLGYGVPGGPRLQPGQAPFIPSYAQTGGMYRPGQAAVPVDPYASLGAAIGTKVLNWWNAPSGNPAVNTAATTMGNAPNSIPDVASGSYGDLNTYDPGIVYDGTAPADLANWMG